MTTCRPYGMLWIALAPPSPACAPSLPDGSPEQQALGWWALQFTPRVCIIDEAVLAEVQASCRLFGGTRALLQRVRAASAQEAVRALAVAPTALAALALLRQCLANATPDDRAAPTAAPTTDPTTDPTQATPAMGCRAAELSATLDALPLDWLSAARPHLASLHRLGCATWRDVKHLPRGGLTRRFGAALLDALDRAYGLKPDTYTWVSLPERFNVRLECPGPVASVEGLLFGVRRLLGQLRGWLQARQCGVTALRLARECEGARRWDASPAPAVEIRTATATLDMRHLERLCAEHLARQPLNAPVVALRLEALTVEPWAPSTSSLLPEEISAGESLAQCLERLAARLGPHAVQRGQLQADYRPERMTVWEAAVPWTQAPRPRAEGGPAWWALQPPWLLESPLKLAVVQERPFYQGALTLLTRPQRIETGWWDAEVPVLRDYYVAESPQAGLLWVYRLRAGAESGWYLHGVYG